MVLSAGFHRAVDVRDANAARRLQEDSGRASALARARLGARHGAGCRSGDARADSRDGAHRQETGESTRGRVSGRSAVPADRDDDGRARRQHRQGHHQGRRSLLHVLRRRVVHGEVGLRPVGSDRIGAEGDLRDPPEFAGVHGHARHGRRGQQRRGGLRDCGRGHRHDGRLGLRRMGERYYYPPYVGYGGFYPRYYPFYPTYGFHASYNPWTGAYSRGAVAYGPYGGAGVGARYNPRTGTYARGAAAYGPYGARGAAHAYNPRTGAYGATRQGSGVYGSYGQTGVTRGNQWATTSQVTNRATRATPRTTQTSGGGAAVTRNGAGAGNNAGVARTGSGDMYAGRDGNVYRNTGSGWQQYGSGGWNSVQQPTQAQRDQAQQRAATAGQSSAGGSGTVGQLNQDSAARSEGAQRTRDASAVNSGSKTTNSSSYRPSGGSHPPPRATPRG